MAVLLKDILEIESLKQANIIEDTLIKEHEVTDIMVMEAPDVENWCSPGQLLLSSLYNFQDYSETQQIQFIKKLVDLNVSGLIIKVNRFVGQIPTGILIGSQQYQFPLIQIPNEIRYRDILMEGMQLLFDHKARLLNHYRDVHNHFSRLALNQATSVDIIHALAEFIQNPVSLCTEDFAVLATTNEQLTFCDIQEERDLEERVGSSFSYQRKLVSHPNFHKQLFSQVSIPIYTNEGTTRLLIIHEIHHETLEMDFMAIENAVIALQLDMLKQSAVNNVKQNYLNDLFDDVIYGKCSTREQQLDYAQLLGLAEKVDYRVIIWQFSQEEQQNQTNYEHRQNQNKLAQQLMHRILQYYPKLSYRVHSNRLIFILENHYFKTFSSSHFHQHMETIYKNWTGHPLQLAIGISEVCQLDDLDKEAQKALHIIQQARALKMKDFILFYQDLGIYRMLAELEHTNQLSTFIPSKLALLIETYPDWIDTLKTYLDENQNLKKTADKIFVHYKTVTYRISKIKELTGIQFDNPEELLGIQLGLRIHLLQQG